MLIIDKKYCVFVVSIFILSSIAYASEGTLAERMQNLFGISITGQASVASCAPVFADCSDWSACSGGVQYQSCSDISCDTGTTKNYERLCSLPITGQSSDNLFDFVSEGCDGAGGWWDDCGVCNGGNANKDACGVCFGDGSSCTETEDFDTATDDGDPFPTGDPNPNPNPNPAGEDSCTPTRKTCGETNGRFWIFQHYSNCNGEEVENCGTRGCTNPEGPNAACNAANSCSETPLRACHDPGDGRCVRLTRDCNGDTKSHDCAQSECGTTGSDPDRQVTSGGCIFDLSLAGGRKATLDINSGSAFQAGTVGVGWGDGSPQEQRSYGLTTRLEHTYASDGEYRVGASVGGLARPGFNNGCGPPFEDKITIGSNPNAQSRSTPPDTESHFDVTIGSGSTRSELKVSINATGGSPRITITTRSGSVPAGVTPENLEAACRDNNALEALAAVLGISPDQIRCSARLPGLSPFAIVAQKNGVTRIYQIFDINSTINNSGINNAQLDFTVSKSWLQEFGYTMADIKLIHYVNNELGEELTGIRLLPGIRVQPADIEDFSRLPDTADSDDIEFQFQAGEGVDLKCMTSDGGFSDDCKNDVTALLWRSVGMTSCVASATPSSSSWTGRKAIPSGITSFTTPSATNSVAERVYKITCTNENGAWVKNVTVGRAGAKPVINFNCLDAENGFQDNTCFNKNVRLQWHVENADSCRAITLSGASPWSGEKTMDSNDELVEQLSASGYGIYMLRCRSAGGIASAVVVVNHIDTESDLPITILPTNTTNATSTTQTTGTVINNPTTTVPTGPVNTTAAPVPTVDFRCKDENGVYTRGPCKTLDADLKWTSNNALTCTATSVPSSPSWIGARDMSFGGGAIESLFSSRIYVITCSGTGGRVTSSVSVVPPTSLLPNRPFVDLFCQREDGDFINGPCLNANAVLKWSSSNATSCTVRASPEMPAWSGAKPLLGASESIGSVTRSTTFFIVCTGPGGTRTDSSVVIPPVAP